MKVAMIGHKVVPSRRGGIENVLTSLCPLLIDEGVQVTCYNRSSDKVEEDYQNDVKDSTYRGVKLKKAFTLNVKGISAMLSSFTAAISASFGKYDVIHFHAEGPCAAMWIPKLFGKKCIATVHGLDWQREKWAKGFGSKYIKFGEKVLAKYADEIIVLSESAGSYFKETYGRDTVLIRNGISKPVYRDVNIIKEKYGLEKDGYICIVSRLTYEKGVHYLIDAYNKISTDKKLVIAGDTSDTDEYAALLREKAKDNPNIIFTGFITSDTLYEMYSNAYAVALPSDLEGMSLSLLEALSYENAVICSDIPENTSVAEDKAIYFRKSDIDDLADKLRFICDNGNEVMKLRTGLCGFIAEKYNWENVAKSTYSLYQKMTERGK